MQQFDQFRVKTFEIRLPQSSIINLFRAEEKKKKKKNKNKNKIFLSTLKKKKKKVMHLFKKTISSIVY